MASIENIMVTNKEPLEWPQVPQSTISEHLAGAIEIVRKFMNKEFQDEADKSHKHFVLQEHIRHLTALMPRGQKGAEELIKRETRVTPLELKNLL